MSPPAFAAEEIFVSRNRTSDGGDDHVDGFRRVPHPSSGVEVVELSERGQELLRNLSLNLAEFSLTYLENKIVWLGDDSCLTFGVHAYCNFRESSGYAQLLDIDIEYADEAFPESVSVKRLGLFVGDTGISRYCDPSPTELYGIFFWKPYASHS
jgi:hypothetical protein